MIFLGCTSLSELYVYSSGDNGIVLPSKSFETVFVQNGGFRVDNCNSINVLGGAENASRIYSCLSILINTKINIFMPGIRYRNNCLASLGALVSAKDTLTTYYGNYYGTVRESSERIR